jgi:hypothetical protein
LLKLVTKSNHKSYNRFFDLEPVDEIYSLLNKSKFIDIASSYYRTEAFYRFRPSIDITIPDRDDITSRDRSNLSIDDLYDSEPYSDTWHLDSVYNLQYHVLLNDIDP